MSKDISRINYRNSSGYSRIVMHLFELKKTWNALGILPLLIIGLMF